MIGLTTVSSPSRAMFYSVETVRLVEAAFALLFHPASPSKGGLIWSHQIMNACGCGFVLRACLVHSLASSLVLCTSLKHPLTYDGLALVISSSVLTLVVLLGDFNTLNVMNILANHTLKQLVREPTRGNNVLDLVISNLASYYNKPVVSAHLGSSDHRLAKKKVVKMRRFPVSALNAFGRWVSVHSWFARTCAADSLSVDSLTSSFSDDLCNAINIYFPAKSVQLHPTDKPWMSAEIKSLILEQQRAYHSGSNDRWRLLRNKVRIAICKRKKEFFARKVMSLKTSVPRSWWSLVSKLANLLPIPSYAILTNMATLSQVKPLPLV